MNRSAIAFVLLASLAACVDDSDIDDAERRRPRPSPSVDAGTVTPPPPSGYACDGPEDCNNGNKCCATISSSGVKIGCQAECLPYFQHGEELCHEPSVCSNNRWCITAWGTQPALDPALAICR